MIATELNEHLAKLQSLYELHGKLSGEERRLAKRELLLEILETKKTVRRHENRAQ